MKGPYPTLFGKPRDQHGSITAEVKLIILSPLSSVLSLSPIKAITMPDSKKSPSIPSWQQRPENSPAEQSSSDEYASRQNLIDQASRFLEDDSIRDAPTARKVSFLESKGLTSEEIENLLGLSSNSLPAAEDKPSPSHDSSTNQASSPFDTMSQQTAQTTSTPHEVPPIITYPEFLFQQSKPPPLVTMRTILYTIYGVLGLGASIHGASEYLLQPMLADLTHARHELATTAQTNLQKLNEKLEHSVSVIPPQLTARKTKSDGTEDEADAISITSDPTELFHRDVATQTSPDSLSSDSTDTVPPSTTTGISNHLTRLESIQSQLNEMIISEKEGSSVDDTMRSRLTDLHHYLDGLIYNAPPYTVAGPSYGLYSGNVSSSVDGTATGVRKSEDDAIASFKAEIRGVKGALLSARNFPAGRGGRLGGVAGGK